MRDDWRDIKPLFNWLPASWIATIEFTLEAFRNDRRLSPADVRYEQPGHGDIDEMLRLELLIIDRDVLRPSLLGVFQVQNSAVLDTLVATLEVVRRRYRPRAAPMQGAELLREIGTDPTAEWELPFVVDLRMGLDGPPWILHLREDVARKASLASLLKDRYRERFGGGRQWEPLSRPDLALRARRLHVERLRGLRHLDLQLTSGLQVLVGPNGVGKSSALMALAFLADAARDGVEQAVQEAGGLSRLRTRGESGSLVVEVAFDVDVAGDLRAGRYGFSLAALDGQVCVETERLELTRDDRTARLLIDGTRSASRIERRDGSIDDLFHPAGALALTEIDHGASPAIAHLRAALENVALVDPYARERLTSEMVGLRERPSRRLRVQDIGRILELGDADSVSKLGALAHTLVPGILRLELEDDLADSGPRRRLVVVEEGAPGHTPLEDLSRGTQQLLLMAALYLTPRPPRMLLLEEPDAAVHVGALPALRDLLVSLATRSTVVATSQSPTFVGLLDAERHVTAFERIKGETRTLSLAEALRSRAWLESFAGAEAFVRLGSERPR